MNAIQTTGIRIFAVALAAVIGPLGICGPLSYAATSLGMYVSNGINSAGDVAGYNCNGPCEAVVYSGGTLTQLGFLPGGTVSYATGINDAGYVIGYGDTASGSLDAFVWKSGTMTDLGTLGGTQTIAFAINNAASPQITGEADTAGGQPRAFLYDSTGMHDLNTPRASRGYAINDSGVVAGSSSDPTFHGHAFTSANGSLTDLGTLGGSYQYSTARGINNSGEVVGYDFDANTGRTEAFLFSGGSLQDLGNLGGTGASVAWAINDSGLVVGQASSARLNNGEAFLYTNGLMYSLTDLVVSGLPPGDFLSSANGINSSGQIIAGGYLLTPDNQAAPEPGTLGLTAAGLIFAALGLGRRCHNC